MSSEVSELQTQIQYQLMERLLESEQRCRELELQLKNVDDETNMLARRVIDSTQALAKYQAELRELTAQLTLAEQRERQRLAQTLHDHLQQHLVAARMQLAALRQNPNAEVSGPAQLVDRLLKESLETSRSLTVELNPPVLFQDGLARALHWLARHMQHKYGLRTRVDAIPEAEPQAEDVKILLFQAVRELLFNVVKHAGVDEATVAMQRHGARLVHLIVSDSGKGFDRKAKPTSSNGGFGLFGVRQRIEMSGGQLAVESELGRGTRVTIIVPYGPPSAADSWDALSGDGHRTSSTRSTS